MGETTGISWTQHTWNPWQGCEQVSPGCDHCYAKTLTERWGRKFEDVRRSAKATFYAPLKWQKEAAVAGEQRLVFTCSMSDFFHADADPWRPEVWEMIKATPNLTYQVLTKRHGRIAKCLPPDWGDGYPNVWLGVSVENQFWADRRILELLNVPAAVRFLSMEPLLGPVDLTHLTIFKAKHPNDPEVWLNAMTGIVAGPDDRLPKVDWVIVGGESGPGYRPMDHEWARSIRDQTQAAGVAFFFKQSAAPRTEMGRELDGQRYEQMPKVQA